MGQKTITDEELLDWAQQHPEAVLSAIEANWALCGGGARETFFNFRLCILDAKSKVRPLEVEHA